MGREYFHFDAEAQTLMGADTGLTIGIGQRVTVRLAEAVPVTGGLILDLLEVDGKDLPRGPQRPGKPPKRGRRSKPGKRPPRRRARWCANGASNCSRIARLDCFRIRNNSL